jgi:hypothetical protein
MGLIAQQSEALRYTIAANAKAAGVTAVLNRFCFDLSVSASISWAMPPALLAVPFENAVLRTAWGKLRKIDWGACCRQGEAIEGIIGT